MDLSVAALTVTLADQEQGGVDALGLGCPQLLCVSLISQFIGQAWLSGEPSVLKIHQRLSAGHHSLRDGAPTLKSPAGQLASTLFWTQRDNKTISLNQEHLPIPSSHCHSHCLPLRYTAVLKSPWLILLFFYFLPHFVSQMKHFRLGRVKDVLSLGGADGNR